MAATIKTVKVQNYTVEQTEMLKAGYLGGQTVEMLAVTFAKSVRSIVAKLSREKVYVAKAYTTKTGEKVVKKDEFADSLAALVGLTEAEADSLTKANKTALAKIVAFIGELATAAKPEPVEAD